MTNMDILKTKMIAALEKSLGVVTTACKSVDIARQTHYTWMQDDEAYKRAVDGISDVALDFAESQLHKQIQNGEVSSTIFYLKCKGKKRGYIERTEVSLDGNVKVSNTIELSTLDNDELRILEKLIAGQNQVGEV